MTTTAPDRRDEGVQVAEAIREDVAQDAPVHRGVAVHEDVPEAGHGCESVAERGIEPAARGEQAAVIETTIEMRKDWEKDDRRAQQLGLAEDELAFFDAVAAGG